MNLDLPIIDWHAFGQQFLYDPKNPLLFNNGFFLYFFALFMGLYYAFRNKFNTRRYIFCFFSLYFFYKASGFFVGFVILSALVNYILSNKIYKQTATTKKALLVVSVIFNLGLLFYFKYTNFFIATVNEFLSAHYNPLNILLPVGISFYTFENLSYTIDVYRGDFEPAKKFSDYLLFLSFFPKLVMGPIVRAHDFVPQINKPFQLSEQDLAKGFYLIITGMFKKLIISDYLTLNYVNFVFDDPARYSGLENLMAVYAYALVIYCDFSGYSDVAIGIAKWLGFTIPANFLSPYQSKNISEFWRRWHISLSSWLRDYLYIPIGGNRSAAIGTFLFPILFFIAIPWVLLNLVGLSLLLSISITGVTLLLFISPGLIKKEKTGIYTNFNLLTTMLLGGLWHGASWNFIIWGALHGTGLAIHKIWSMGPGKLFSKGNNGLVNAVSVIITFHFVCLGWIFFKAHSFQDAGNMIFQIFNNMDFSIWKPFVLNYKIVLAMMLLAFITHSIADSFIDKKLAKVKSMPFIAYLVIYLGFVLLYGVFKSADPVLPIYLQF